MIPKPNRDTRGGRMFCVRFQGLAEQPTKPGACGQVCSGFIRWTQWKRLDESGKPKCNYLSIMHHLQFEAEDQSNGRKHSGRLGPVGFSGGRRSEERRVGKG